MTRSEYKHSVHGTRADADVVKDAKIALIQRVDLIAEDGPVDVGQDRRLDGREHVKDVHLSIHDKGPKCSLNFGMYEETVVRRHRRRHDGLAELCAVEDVRGAGHPDQPVVRERVDGKVNRARERFDIGQVI